MKKFLTLLSAALIAVASFATVASADDLYKPTVALDITNKLPNGAAQITVSVNVEKELDFHNEGDGYDWYMGSGVTDWQIGMNLDSSIFAKSEAIIAGNYMINYANVKPSVSGKVTIGTATVMLNADYKSKSIDELNALNFAEVTEAIITITEWNGGYDANDGSSIVGSITYATDGNGDYGVDLSKTRIGTYVDTPEPPVDEKDYGTNGNDYRGKKTKYWTVNYGAGEFTGNASISFTDGTDTKTLDVRTAPDYTIGGAVSFYVYVIGDDVADVYIVE